MAIHPSLEEHSHSTTPAALPAQSINIAAWTHDVTQAHANVVPAPSHDGAQGTSVSLSIDLDEHREPNGEFKPCVPHSENRPRREPIRRDSLKRREALLKGKEGSRRRTRWENDRLVDNPWAQPPLPSDFEVHPTYPRHTVPYYLAPLWDKKMAVETEDENREKNSGHRLARGDEESLGKVPRQLREKLKKTKAAKGLLKDLEEQVRLFVENWSKSKSEKQVELDSEDEEIVFVGRNDSDDEEIVFVGRNGRESWDEEQLETNQLVFDSLANDQGASFGRWLVHSIASYYGLQTWSVTVGDPARREAYVGIPPAIDNRQHVSPLLLRPLYGMV